MSITGPIMAASSIAGAAISGHAAGHAADTQAAASEQAAQLQHEDAQQALGFNEQQYLNALRLGEPYYGTGTQALGSLAYLMGLTPQQPNMGVFSNPFSMTNPSGFGTGFGATPNPFATPEAQLTVPNPNAPVPMNAESTMVRDLNGNPVSMPTPGAGFDASRFSRIRPEMMVADGGSGLDFNQIPDAGGNGGPMMQPFPGANPNSGGGANLLPGNDGGIETVLPNVGGLPQGFLTQPFDEKFQAPTDITEQNDPGFQARLKYGADLLQQSAAAKGNLLSGGFARELSDYGQQTASEEYGNVYNRAHQSYIDRYNIFKQNQNDIYNRFASLAGLGQTSAGTLANEGIATGNTIGNTLLTSGAQIGQQLNNAAAARASGYIGGANALSGGLSSISNLGMLYALLNQGGGGGNPFAGASASASGAFDTGLPGSILF
jgi:hypothetical protein